MAGLHSFINRFNIIKQIPLFSKLSWFDLQRISHKAVLDEYKKSESIRKEGDSADFFYCLISGRVCMYTKNKSGRKENVEFIHRGAPFGILSVLTDESHSHNYDAVNDSVVLKIPKDEFNAILKSIPDLSIQLNQSLSKRVRSAVRGTKTYFESTIISVYSPVKGSGSSSYAINLALSLEQETKKRVVYVSIQSRNNKTEIYQDELAMTPQFNNPPINIEAIAGDHDEILKAIVKNELAIDFLHVDFNSSDSTLRKEISPFVSTLVNDYHYVVVDLPNDMDDIVAETLMQSDVVHLISSDRKKDLNEIKKVIQHLEGQLKENFHENRIRVLIRGYQDKIYFSFEEIEELIDYSVYAAIPLIHPDELTIDINSKSVVLKRADSKCQYSKTLTRIAREIGGVLVGLVLGGGAALGVAHIGVIKVLERENIPVDIVVGSSMGALIGSFWAVGKNAAQLEEAARDFKTQRDMLKLFDPFIVPIAGLIGDRAIIRWLRKHLGNLTFYSTKIPFKAVSYDLIRREELVIDTGSLIDAVRQSIAIPGVLEPIKIKGQVIIDGGVLNPLPTNVLSSMGIKKIIAVNVLQSPQDTSAGFDLSMKQLERERKITFKEDWWFYIRFRIGRFLAKIVSPNIPDIIVNTLQATEYVLAEQSAQQADIVIRPNLVGINWFELYKVDQLVKAGEDATRALLPEIKKLIEEN